MEDEFVKIVKHLVARSESQEAMSQFLTDLSVANLECVKGDVASAL